jgi:hypothetical protein
MEKLKNSNPLWYLETLSLGSKISFYFRLEGVPEKYRERELKQEITKPTSTSHLTEG